MKRLQNRARVAMLVGTATLLTMPILAHGESDKMHFAIPSENLGGALNKFARQSRQQLLFSPALVAGRQSSPLRGAYEPQEALGQLLDGTGIQARTTSAGAILLAAAEQPASSPPPSRPEPPAGGISPRLQEVIVTARKRQESILNVPVIEIAISQEKLERLQTQDLQDLTNQVPGFRLGESVLSIGTQVSLRGVGTSTLDAGVDQSVSLNLDGLQLSQGLAYASGMFDVQQVEVLKGPQALFYGKNSPGGVISLRTADPGDHLEAIARAGYEFLADEKRGELILSGPLSERFGVRLATMYDKSEGFFHNEAVPAPGTGAVAPHGSNPPSESYIIRGTLLGKLTDDFTARLKMNYVHDKVKEAGLQLVSCPDGISAPGGIPFIGGNEDCRKDRTLNIVNVDPAIFPNVKNNGTPFIDTKQAFGTLELTQNLSPELTLSSTTGYYTVTSDSAINATQTTFAAPPFVAQNAYKRHDATEELRLNSDFSSPVNFTVGAFYQDANVKNRISTVGNTVYFFPALLNDGYHDMDITAYSGFGQVRWAVIPQVEIAAGARWSHEKRTDKPIDLLSGTATPVALATPEIKSTNTSPELTVTYKPTDDVTVFGSLKRGYKSGSFTITGPAAPDDNNAFGDEEVEGGEVGVKTRLLDHQLAVDLAAYRYRYTGLQVGANTATASGLPVEQTVNAGAARVYGVDLDVAFHPSQIEGLNLYTSAEWNRARFQELDNVPCWGGQMIAEGCNEFFNTASGLFTSQNLRGLPLVRAPNSQVNFGFDYEMPVGSDLALAISNNNQYSSKYLVNLGRRDDFYQKSFIKSDVALTLKNSGDLWEVALIGKNVTDRRTASACSNSNFANGVILFGQVTGGTTRGPAGIDELGCFLDRGREVWLRLTVKPSF